MYKYFRSFQSFYIHNKLLLKINLLNDDQTSKFDCFDLFLSNSFVARSCRCLWNNSTCWPSATVWQEFNISVDGRLLMPHPSAAAPYTKDHYDAALCDDTYTHWMDSVW